MQENDYVIHLRARDDLLKSIVSCDDYTEEATAYMDSLRNIMNKEMILQNNPVDDFCYEASTMLLYKKTIGDLSAELAFGGRADEGYDYDKKGRISRRTVGPAVASHRHVNELIDNENIELASSLFPRVVPGDSNYKHHHFHESIHPLRKKNSSTGNSRMVEKLLGYVRKDDDGNSVASSHADAERAHETHYDNLRNPIIIGQIRKSKRADMDDEISHGFLGRLTTNDSNRTISEQVGTSGAFQEGLYERAFTKWSSQNQKRIDEAKSQGASDKDIREMHLEEAAELWQGRDFEEEDIPLPPSGDIYSTLFAESIGERQEGSRVAEGVQTEFPTERQHPHRLGLLGYGLGLEWLSPIERTKVIEHLKDNNGNTSDKIKLDDGTEIPLGRLRRNFQKRMTPLYLHSQMPHNRGQPNLAKHLESDELDGTEYTGSETEPIRSLLAKIDHGVHGNMFDSLLNHYNELLELQGDQKLTHIPIYGEKRTKKIREKIDELIEKGVDEKEALRTILKVEDYAPVSNFTIPQLKKHLKEHPLSELLTDEGKKPLAHENMKADDYINQLEEMYRDGMSLARDSKDIANANAVFAKSAGPDIRDVPEEIRNHFIEKNGTLRGLSDYWAHDLQVGSNPMESTTFFDMLNSIAPGLFGEMDENGFFVPRPDMSGFLGAMHHVVRERGESFSPAEIMSMHDQSLGASHVNLGDKKPRNRANGSDTAHSLTPRATTFWSRSRNPKAEITRDSVGFLKTKGEKRAIHETQYHEFGTKTGSTKSEALDSKKAHNSSEIMREYLMSGAQYKFGSIDPNTGRRRLGSPVMRIPVNEMLGGKHGFPFEDDEEGGYSAFEKALFALSGFLGMDDTKRIAELQSELEEIELSGEDASQELIDELKGRIHMQQANLRAKISGFGKTRLQEKERRAEAEERARMEVAKNIVIPAMLEIDPNLIDPNNPEQTVANLSQAMHDSELIMKHMPHGFHGQSIRDIMIGDAVDEQTIDAMVGGDMFRRKANVLEEEGTLLSFPESGKVEDMHVTASLIGMGLPYTDSGYREYMRELLESLEGKPAHYAMTTAQLAAHGNEDFHLFDDDGMKKDPMRAHQLMDDELKRYRSQIRGLKLPDNHKNDFNNNNEHYNSINNNYMKLSMAHKGNTAIQHGLSLSDLPKDIHGNEDKGKGAERLRYEWAMARAKRKANSLVLFNPEARVAAPTPPPAMPEGQMTLDQFGDTGTNLKRPIKMGDAKIGPVTNPNSDAIIGSRYTSAGIQQHMGIELPAASVSLNLGYDGNMEYGTNTSAGPAVPPSEPVMKELMEHFQEGSYNQMDAYFQVNGVNEAMLPSTTSNMERVSPDNPKADMQTPYEIGKSLPKEMPLIEPYHKIFDMEDLQELRGFTGEWVVSVMEEGTRVKVTRKSNRIEVKDDDNEDVGTSDGMRSSLRKIGKNNYVMDAVLNSSGLHIFDIMHYDDTDVTDMPTRERIKLLRGQFDSNEDVFVPGPFNLKVTDDDGLSDAIKFLQRENKDSKLLLRDAKSTYMKGEEKHPKWILMTKSDDDYHVPFGMEIDGEVFILHFDHDILKYDIVEDSLENPRSALGGLKDRDYTMILAKSLEKYWEPAFQQMLKAEKKKIKEIVEEDEDDKEEDEGISEEDAKRIGRQSGGVLKPNEDQNILLKPSTLEALEKIEKILDTLEKGHFPMTAGKGLGVDVGSDIDSPRGPTKLANEATLPDYDMKERPEQDPEKPEDYPKRKKIASRSNDS